MYRITEKKIEHACDNNEVFFKFKLDGSVYFERNQVGWEIGFFSSSTCDSLQVGDYVEIDLDYTRTMGPYQISRNTSAIRKLSSSVAMINTSSVNPTALAVTREGVERINRGEIREFEYKMEDVAGNKHHWIYRK